MNDMSVAIAPKSDQINADDLLAAPMTVTIAGVTVKGGAEQPVSIQIAGNPKVYRPCKSMCRVMVSLWGSDANNYVGRSMTLYCDPKVTWGAMAVGGIRISHMSDIDAERTLALTATKGSKKAFTVRLLAKPAEQPKRRTWTDALADLETDLNAAQTTEQVDEIIATERVQKMLDTAQNGTKTKLDGIIKAALDRTADDFPGVVTRDDDTAEVDRIVRGYGTDNVMAG